MCNRFAIDGKPVGWAGPESWAANAKGRMQSMPGTASAWVFKMASREDVGFVEQMYRDGYVYEDDYF